MFSSTQGHVVGCQSRSWMKSCSAPSYTCLVNKVSDFLSVYIGRIWHWLSDQFWRFTQSQSQLINHKKLTNFITTFDLDWKGFYLAHSVQCGVLCEALPCFCCDHVRLSIISRWTKKDWWAGTPTWALCSRQLMTDEAAFSSLRTLFMAHVGVSRLFNFHNSLVSRCAIAKLIGCSHF